LENVGVDGRIIRWTFRKCEGGHVLN
jgi:hypothetical protein